VSTPTSKPIDGRIERFEHYLRHRLLRIAEILAARFVGGTG
jgi:hypothetical protein